MSLRRRMGILGPAVLVGAAVTLLGCESTQLGDGLPPADEVQCNSCHGNEVNAAPPTATDGSTETTAIGVGAHQAHLTGGELRKALACEECHVVPETVDAPGHVDPLPAEITFGDLATQGSPRATWDRTAATCSNTYCHGATLQGGKMTAPVWTAAPEGGLGCDACHGNPPPAPHPQTPKCAMCHAETVRVDGTIDIEGGRHIDGTIQAIGAACDSCHGSGGVAAPPKDLAGNTETTALGVGAHRKHLGASTWHAEVACAECHLVPKEVGDPGHVDTELPVELTWGATAMAGGTQPEWDRATATCAGSWCHGGGLAPTSLGDVEAPRWTQVDGAQATCGSCHGNPPSLPHPDRTDCGTCHGDVIGVDGKTFVDPTLHINGKVDVAPLTCSSCHGEGGTAAPPVDTKGNEDPSSIGVGAHRKHLTASAWHREVTCNSCHVVPEKVGDPGHADTALPAEIVWGGLANANATSPVWDHDAATCSGSYCHGATLDGGALQDPIWTQVDGTQAQCTSCHGNPPGGAHPTRSDCSTCHGAVIAPDGSFLNGAKHIDGKVDVGNLSCSSCHGSNANAAPPVDLSGESATTRVTVGAHQAHLGPSEWHAEVACATCHTVPTAIDSVGHADSPAPAELTWTGVAVANGSKPAWDEGAATCANTWCHGAGLSGGSATAPVWTQVDGTQKACTSCHGMPPTENHVPRTDCATCHGAVIDEAGDFVDPELHVDGKVEVITLKCDTCHGDAGNPAPPVDVKGNAATTEIGVGAHRAHLGPSDWHKALECSACHVVPGAVDAAGHMDSALPAELTFGALATAEGQTPAWDSAAATCSSTYCHGSTLSGGTVTAPVWTQVDGTQAACGTCHGMPPAAPHVPRKDCGTCHGMVVTSDGFVDPTLHIDGKVDVVELSCSTCHGGAENAAPPVSVTGESGTELAGVGAHQKHLGASSWHKQVACADCHVVPETVGAEGHLDTALPAELTWSGVAVAEGSTPAWDEGTTSCSGAYCHGATLSAGEHTTPNWTLVDGTQTTCTGCHGMPPAVGHPQNDNCSLCHGAVVTADGFADPSLHIDGRVEVVPQTCDGCHGSDGNPAPPKDVAGNTETTAPGVGAHRSHVLAATWHKQIACSDCHKVPEQVDDAGHIDSDLPAELTFGALATTGGSTPAFDEATTSCSGAYCHGATLTGGEHTAPNWTLVDGSQKTCTSCHGQPPTENHVPRTDCETCHSDVVDANGFVAPEKHIDGKVEVIALSCNTCHGSELNPAPPSDVMGNTETTAPGVGAHQAHLAASTWHRDVECADCHKVPTDVKDQGHMDSALPAELTFGAVATADGAAPSFDEATTTCSGAYCHGATLSAGEHTAPNWTQVDGTQTATCTSCHGMPPADGHPALTNCVMCHACTVTPDSLAIDPAHKDLHINGVKNLAIGTCNL